MLGALLGQPAGHLGTEPTRAAGDQHRAARSPGGGVADDRHRCPFEPPGEQTGAAEGELVLTSLTKQAMPVVRYRTRDLTRLLPGTAYPTFRRMQKITGRTDDMMIVRGVNVFPSQVEEQILTIEGLAPPQRLHPVQEAFSACHGLQCGYCTPGMIMATVALLARHPDPTDEEIRNGLAGNLCRCTGYVNIEAAVRMAAAAMRT